MNHHYVPKCYLKRWIASSTHKIFYYTIKHGKVIEGTTYVDSAASEFDLYAKENVPIEEKQYFETNCYSPIDNKAAIVLNKILEKGITIAALADDEKYGFAHFIVSLLCRHKTIIQNAKKSNRDFILKALPAIPSLYKELYKSEIEYLRSNLAIETAAAMVSPIGSLTNKYNIENFDKNIQAVLRMNWWLEDFSQTGLNLLTSDHPVIFLPIKNKTTQQHLMRDFILEGTHVLTLPLSPTICFYAHINQEIAQPDKEGLVQHQNLVTVMGAKEFIYANDNSQKNFIETHILRNPSMVIAPQI